MGRLIVPHPTSGVAAVALASTPIICGPVHNIRSGEENEMCDKEGCVGHGEFGLSEAFIEKLNENIFTYGHTVIGVFDGHPPFSYTAGRAVMEKADLYVSGHLAPETQGLILNTVAEMENKGEINLYNLARSGGGIPEVIDKYDIRVVACDPEKAEMTTAMMLGCTRAFQLLWPDTEGRYPTDEGYDQHRFHQPLMGSE